MQLVERHIIQENNAMYKEIHSECFLSKNLYNRANYLIRKAFIVSSQLKEEGQAKNAIWIRYRAIQKMLQDNKDPDYLALPAKVSQHVLKLLDKNWASFFASIRDWKQNPSKYTGKPNLPKYKHKTNGRNVLTYTIQAISKKELKKGYVLLSGTKIKIHTLQNIADIKQVRVIPRNKQYIIEVIYNKQIEKHENIDTKKIAGGDEEDGEHAGEDQRPSLRAGGRSGAARQHRPRMAQQRDGHQRGHQQYAGQCQQRRAIAKGAIGPAEQRRGHHRPGWIQPDDIAVHQAFSGGDQHVHALLRHDIGTAATEAEEHTIANQQLDQPIGGGGQQNAADRGRAAQRDQPLRRQPSKQQRCRQHPSREPHRRQSERQRQR